MKKHEIVSKQKIAGAIIACLIFAFFMPLSIDAYALELPKEVIAGGRTTGIKLYAQGAVVTGFSKTESPAKDAGIKIGDIIVAVDGSKVNDRSSLLNALASSDDESLVVQIVRQGKPMSISVNALYDENKSGYSIGASVKDTIAGIGTVTYILPENGQYGALGHGISDPDTNSLVPFSQGVLMPSKVISVKKGQEGTPGELVGSYEMETVQGTVDQNTNCGIFGRLNNHRDFCGKEPIPVADSADVKKGKAYILSNIKDDKIEQFDIEIVDINKDTDSMKQMMIKVTDSDLLSTTGGIVQGMSGSPIIQDGKLVGAVTHVLVNDPTRGYGIFIENMLDAAS